MADEQYRGGTDFRILVNRYVAEHPEVLDREPDPAKMAAIEERLQEIEAAERAFLDAHSHWRFAG